MKKIVARCALLGVLIVLLIDTRSYFNNWRPNLFSFRELGSILAGAAFFTLVLMPIYLVVLKLRRERRTLTPGVRLGIGMVAAFVTAAMLYYDDEDGFEKLFSIGGVVCFLVYGFLMFLLASVIFLAFKRKLI